MKKNTIYESLQATHQAVYIGLDVHKKTIFCLCPRTWCKFFKLTHRTPEG